MNKATIGLIGLAVMGENLVLNLESKGYSVAVYNRTHQKIDNFMNSRAIGKNIIPSYSIEDFVNNLEKPRKIMLMVRAGEAVDKTIESLLPYLDKNDIIIDGGNSNYKDSNRRTKFLNSKNILYVGAGVSGGEEGALKGPSIMPGGNIETWKEIKDIFQSISAKVGDNEPCCNWIGPDGSGHFVKMVHNGIEYGDMQLISEIYDIMRKVLNLNSNKMQEIFKDWNTKELNSYLIEITSEILNFRDNDGAVLVEKILDVAGQKGTGKWSVNSALDYNVDLSLITEAVFTRINSGNLDERKKSKKEYSSIKFETIKINDEILNNLYSALFASKIISYAQGFNLIKKASNENNWNLNLSDIALMWRGGCIIRSSFLNNISDAFKKDNNLENLLLDPYFKDIIIKTHTGLRKTLSMAITHGVSTPSLSAALSYFDSYISDSLPTNLIQAQRDFFGAHTYQRIDDESKTFVHTNWTRKGGSTASSNYDV